MAREHNVGRRNSDRVRNGRAVASVMSFYFKDEVPGYLGNDEIKACLENLKLKAGAGNVGENLLACYEALTAKNFFPAKELDLVRAWLEDFHSNKSAQS